MGYKIEITNSMGAVTPDVAKTNQVWKPLLQYFGTGIIEF